MPSLAVRVSAVYESIKDWIADIECDKCIVFQHIADEEINRDHIHMLLVNVVKDNETLKRRYCKLYNPEVKGNSLWSWKTIPETDYDLYITYMSKGTLIPVYNKGFDTVYVVERQCAFVDYKKLNMVDGKLVRDVEKVNKKTKAELLELMRSQVSSGGTTREILKGICKVLMDNKEVIGQYKMLDYYDSFMMYDRKEDWIESMEAKILSRIRI